MKKPLKIYFEDMWGYEAYMFNPHDNYFTDLLSLNYDVTIDSNSDLLIFSTFGNNNINFNCKKLYFLGENSGPWYKHPSTVKCDISLTHFNTDETNYHVPLWVTYIDWFNKTQPRPLPCNPTFYIPQRSLINRVQRKKNKFCNFMYNNPIEDRIQFFNKLSEYKHIDSYGGLLNNIGYSLRGSELDKLNVLNEYKFTIAYESSLQEGYITEKIIHPLSVGSIPIYSGGSRVKEFFNEKAIINAADFETIDKLIDYIKLIDNDDQLYNEYVTQPIFNNNIVPESIRPNTILSWIENKLQL